MRNQHLNEQDGAVGGEWRRPVSADKAADGDSEKVIELSDESVTVAAAAAAAHRCRSCKSREPSWLLLSSLSETSCAAESIERNCGAVVLQDGWQVG